MGELEQSSGCRISGKVMVFTSSRVLQLPISDDEIAELFPKPERDILILRASGVLDGALAMCCMHC